jgi:hypothetical protein
MRTVTRLSDLSLNARREPHGRHDTGAKNKKGHHPFLGCFG